MRLIDIESESFLNEMREKQDACKNLIHNSDNKTKTWTDREHWEGVYGVFVEMALTLKKQSTIDAAPVKHGRWVGKRYNFKTYEIETVPYDPMSFDDIDELTCSVCGKHSLLNGHEEDVPSNYCPHCGAKMDLEEMP